MEQDSGHAHCITQKNHSKDAISIEIVTLVTQYICETKYYKKNDENPFSSPTF
jgi:hypothetical protein